MYQFLLNEIEEMKKRYTGYDGKLFIAYKLGQYKEETINKYVNDEITFEYSQKCINLIEQFFQSLIFEE